MSVPTLPDPPRWSVRKLARQFLKNMNSETVGELKRRIFDSLLRMKEESVAKVFDVLKKQKDPFEPGALTLSMPQWWVDWDDAENEEHKRSLRGGLSNENEAEWDILLLWHITRRYKAHSAPLWEVWKEALQAGANLIAASGKPGDMIWIPQQAKKIGELSAWDALTEKLFEPAIVIDTPAYQQSKGQLLVRTLMNDGKYVVDLYTPATVFERRTMQLIDRPEIRNLTNEILGWAAVPSPSIPKVQSVKFFTQEQTTLDLQPWLPWERYHINIKYVDRGTSAPAYNRAFLPISQVPTNYSNQEAVGTVLHVPLVRLLKRLCQTSNRLSLPHNSPLSALRSACYNPYESEYLYLGDAPNFGEAYGEFTHHLEPQLAIDEGKSLLLECGAADEKVSEPERPLLRPIRAKPAMSYAVWLEKIKGLQRELKGTNNTDEIKRLKLIMANPKHAWGVECLHQSLWSTAQVRDLLEAPFKRAAERAAAARKKYIEAGELTAPGASPPMTKMQTTVVGDASTPIKPISRAESNRVESKTPILNEPRYTAAPVAARNKGAVDEVAGADEPRRRRADDDYVALRSGRKVYRRIPTTSQRERSATHRRTRLPY